MSKPMIIIIAALAAILIVVLAIVAFVILSDTMGTEETATPTIAATATPIIAATITQLAELPPPVIVYLPTKTPIPSTSTPLPLPTNTPLPTDLPSPVATNTSAPVVIVPTNTPVPPPTQPPPPTDPPQQTFGLVATHWALQDRSDYTVNGQVWFEWVLDNTLNQPVDYGALGAMPRKDGADRPDWVKISWGDPGSQIPAEGLSADDHLLLPERGNYTLRLVICFDPYETCAGGGGTWTTLSHEIPFTIN